MTVSTISTNRSGNVIAVQHPLYGQGKTISYWHQEGAVCFADERDNCKPHERKGTMTWQDAAERMLATSKYLDSLKSSLNNKSGYERERQVRFLEDMSKVIEAAKNHGSPLDRIEALVGAGSSPAASRARIVPRMFDM